MPRRLASHGSPGPEDLAAFRATFELAGVGIAHVAPGGRWLRVNRKLCEIFGYGRDQLLARTFEDLTYPDDRGCDHEQAHRLLGGEIETYALEKRCLHASGAIVWIHLTASLVRRQDGTPEFFVTVVEDVTVRQGTQDEPRLVASVLERVSDAIVALDNDWRYTYVSQKAAEMLQRRRPEDLIGRHIWTEYPEGVGQPFHQAYLRARETQQPQTLEQYYEPWDRWFENRIYPSPDGLTIYFSEVTERKRAERSLRENEERYRQLVDLSPDGIAVVDAASDEIVFMNPAGARLLGEAGPASVVGRPASEILHPEDAPAVRDRIGRLLKGEAGLYPAEERRVRFDGSIVAVEVVASILSYEGRPSVRSVFRDIGPRQKAAEQLRGAQERLSLAIEAGKVGLWDWDLRTNEVYFSPEWKRQIGFEDNEIVNAFREWETRVHPADLDRTQKAIREYRADPQPGFEVEFRFRHKDGSFRWILTRAQVTCDAAGRPVRMLGCHLDITERKQAETQSVHERVVLEELATGAPLPNVLARLALAYEEMFPGTLSSVLLLDAEGKRVRHGAAPSLPEAYWQAIDGQEIGPAAGSCGTAAYTRQTTVVSDIANDPLWRDYKDLALAHGLRACWSVPVVSSQDRVLGTFALYYRETRAPQPSELAAVERGARLAGLAIERHQLSQSLRESEDRYRTLVEAFPDAVCIARNDRITFVNPAAVRLVGAMAPDALVGKHLEEFAPPEDRAALAGRIQGVMDSGFGRFERKLLRLDGTTVDTETTAVTFADCEGPAIQVVFRDITQRVQAGQALHERTSQLEMALRAAGLGVWHWDFPSDTVTTLKGGGPISGLPAADYPATGEAFKALVHPEDRGHVADQVRRAVESREDYEAEFRIVVPSTRAVRWVSARGRCLYAAAGTPVVLTGVDMDITERRQAEEEVRRLNVELEQRVLDRTAELNARTRELETFAYSVSHDLKAPLRGIDGYSRLLLDDHSAALDEEGRTFLHNVRQATSQMSRLIDDLLAYSRLERRPLHALQVDLPALVEGLVDDRAREIRDRKALVDQQVPAIVVSADKEGLALALRNLLDNALKFTKDVPQPRIEIGGRAGDGTCTVWVRDNGVGFEMKFHERIFEVFQRLQRSEHFPGTGIGLAMVRKAMERMGGRAWAESEPGKGATFFLEIPREP